MSRIRLVLSLSLLLAGCQSSEKSAGTNQVYGGPQSTVTMRVNGMSCPLCAHNIKQQLVKQPGVRDVKIDLGQGIVTVFVSESAPVKRDAYVQAISDSGFTVVDLNEKGKVIQLTCSSCTCENCRCNVANSNCDSDCRCTSS